MYCKNCGQRYINERAKKCRVCNTLKGYGNRFCAKCGAPIQDASGHCYNCGNQNFQMKPYHERKSKVAAGLLGIFLGGWGAHNFYLGYYLFAIIQVSVYAVACILNFIPYMWMLGVPVCLGIYIWGFVEGIMILAGTINTDAEGNPLRD